MVLLALLLCSKMSPQLVMLCFCCGTSYFTCALQTHTTFGGLCSDSACCVLRQDVTKCARATAVPPGRLISHPAFPSSGSIQSFGRRFASSLPLASFLFRVLFSISCQSCSIHFSRLLCLSHLLSRFLAHTHSLSLSRVLTLLGFSSPRIITRYLAS